MLQPDALPDAEHQALLQFLYQTPVGLIAAEPDGRIRLVTPMAVQLLLPLAPQGAFDNLFDLLGHALPQLRGLVLARTAERGAVCEALRFAGSAAGTPGDPVTLSLSLFRAADGTLTAVLHDATREERRQRRRLDAAAGMDSLTGLLNRRAVDVQIGKRLAQAKEAGRTLVVAFINADRFQHINDTAGHAAGDAALAQMASRLFDALRPQPALAADTVPASLDRTLVSHGALAPLVGRVGGDEFVVVADQDMPDQNAEALSASLMRVLGQPYPIGGRLLACPASIGLVLVAPGSASADESLYRARLAMSEAKDEGGGRAKLFEPAMLQRASWRSSVQNDLRGAIADGQIYVVYQPVVRLEDGWVEALEALVRWRHPVHGLVSPAQFIPIAEQSGLIDELGLFVLDTACRQFADWQHVLKERAPALVAVNLSRGQLPHAGLAERIERTLKDCGMHATALQLEVTETIAAQDESVQLRLKELKHLGLTLALDDFGTGYSSLASLHQLPIDVLKIDRSFVSQLETSQHHRVLVEATIKVARSLGLRTVAEGVETAGQARTLAAMQCDKGQGYLFSPPLDAADFVPWLQARGTREY